MLPLLVEVLIALIVLALAWSLLPSIAAALITLVVALGLLSAGRRVL